MKNILTILFFSFLINTAFGQNVLKEAYVQYEMNDISSDDPQVEAMLQMMKGSTIDIFFNDIQQRVNMEMMGGMMKMSTFTGLEGDHPNILYMEMMGQKMKIPMDEEQLKEYQAKGDEASLTPIVEVVNGEEINILGYKCKKVKVTYEEENGMSMIAYVTEEIFSPASVMQNGNDQLDLGGFPLAYYIIHPQMTMKYEAVKLEQAIPSNAFEQPTDYREMEFADFIKNMGAFGGMGQ